MSVLHIAEVSHLANDCLPMPPLATQAVTYTTSSVQSSAFNAQTRVIRVHSDANAWVVVGANPTATVAGTRLAAGQTERFYVKPGDKIAVIGV